jgi:hypothetical protein
LSIYTIEESTEKITNPSAETARARALKKSTLKKRGIKMRMFLM